MNSPICCKVTAAQEEEEEGEEEGEEEEESSSSRWLRQEDLKLKASLGYIASPCLKIQSKLRARMELMPSVDEVWICLLAPPSHKRNN